MKSFLPIPLAGLFVFLMGGCAGAQSVPANTATETQAPLDPKQYILVATGDLPIVLSAPHGGEVVIPGIPERAFGENDLDVNTLQLAIFIQAELASLTGGKKAHLVAARVSRSYVDLNRASSRAYESEVVAPIYKAYHDALFAAVKEAKALAGPNTLFIDIHGQSADVTKVFRGTQDGQTGDLSMLCRTNAPGLIATMGLNKLIVEPSTTHGYEASAFLGGFIVRTYGLHGVGGINAIQLEFGRDYRENSEAITKTVRAVATALVAYLKTINSAQ